MSRILDGERGGLHPVYVQNPRKLAAGKRKMYVGASYPFKAIAVERMTFALLEFAFIRGLAAGFALAAPVGPVAMLCIRRALAHGRLQGFAAGLGAAFADMMFGAIAGLGLTVISTVIIAHEFAIGLVGGIVVLAVGLITYRAPVLLADGQLSVQSLRRDFATAFSMAITNPATMMAALGVFAAFGPTYGEPSPADGLLLIAGVFGGSALWWLVLAGAAGSWRTSMMERGLKRLNRFSGAIMVISGAAVLGLALARGLAN
ncbi:MAG: LysE family translocator [Rhodospirillaceae bacterium]